MDYTVDLHATCTCIPETDAPTRTLTMYHSNLTKSRGVRCDDFKKDVLKFSINYYTKQTRINKKNKKTKISAVQLAKPTFVKTGEDNGNNMNDQRT